ncbi:pirin family protein [Sesbania bispinosa]|nr:pirin family protein [Sesbania bispinosa]
MNNYGNIMRIKESTLRVKLWHKSNIEKEKDRYENAKHKQRGLAFWLTMVEIEEKPYIA